MALCQFTKLGPVELGAQVSPAPPAPQSFVLIEKRIKAGRENLLMLSPFQIFGPSAVSETRSSFLSIALCNVSLFVCCFCEMNLILHSNNEESQTVDRIKKIY